MSETPRRNPSGLSRLTDIAEGTTLGVAHVRSLAREAEALARNGRATPAVAAALRRIERRSRMAGPARALFEQLLARLGVASELPIGLPLDERPFWLRGDHPLADFSSSPDLPETADVVVIGAGLTGASAAYHLSPDAEAHARRVVVLDKGDPAGEASGRNGGHFELLPENSVGLYEGLARERCDFLGTVYAGLAAEVVRAEGERQASLVLGLALRNRDRLRDIVTRESIDCDFSPRGWLCLAANEEGEQGLCDEVTLAAQHGQRVEIWSRSRIRAEFGFHSDFLGRFIPADGTYHPFKYVCGVLQAALRRGVELYTRTAVREIRSVAPDIHRIVTERGTITARRVIVATNAFTRDLLPELEAIRPRQSQVMITEHAPDYARGRIVTSEAGPVFFNQPRAGARDGLAPLLMGGGDDRPMKNPNSRRRSLRVHRKLLELRDSFYPELRGRPPSSEWVGPMGFTPDQLPAIGVLRPGVIVAAGFNGYGGSFTTAAGQAAAEIALSDRIPTWVPEDAFSPRRLLGSEPLFLAEADGLWRIAVSLCERLEAVNEEISYELRFGAPHDARRAGGRSTPSRPRVAASQGAPSILPETLQAFPLFQRFTADELAGVLALTRRRDLPARTRLFEQGDPGGSCFVVVSGSVDVTTTIRGAEARLATLPAGSLFGQVSVIMDGPRTAACVVRRDAVLLELERDACETLLRGGSTTARKFLGAFNEALIAALRAADRKLLRLREAERARRAEEGASERSEDYEEAAAALGAGFSLLDPDADRPEGGEAARPRPRNERERIRG